jgi:glutathione synthase/RimK-type ligase-like ATP-grasp enzyme
MSQYKAHIALLTDHRYTLLKAPEGNRYVANILKEDDLLKKALEKRGITSIRVDWADPEVDWSLFDCAVFRSTWDYFERFPEFTAWLNRVEKQTRLCNDLSLIRWNMDKHYLRDLNDRGIPVVETRFIEKGSDLNLTGLLDETGWSEGVIKPCVSGAARLTYRVHKSNAEEIERSLQPVLEEESFIFQPFLTDIMATGEDTLVVIAGEVTHAVRKKAKAGDFRVQDDHGGTVHEYTPEAGQIELAKRAMAACEPMPVYGRVDMVRDESGRWVVMELELIEPELWMRFHPPAAEAFAGAIAEFLGGFTAEALRPRRFI